MQHGAILNGAHPGLDLVRKPVEASADPDLICISLGLARSVSPSGMAIPS